MNGNIQIMMGQPATRGLQWLITVCQKRGNCPVGIEGQDSPVRGIQSHAGVKQSCHAQFNFVGGHGRNNPMGY